MQRLKISGNVEGVNNNKDNMINQESLVIRFDGLEAEAHEIDLFSLGASLQGLARIAGTAGTFALTQKYSKYFIAHDVKVLAKEAKANCFSMSLAWTFVQQHQILAGSFGAIAVPLVGYIMAYNANKREEMKLLKEALETAIHQLGNRDQAVISRLLDTVDRMSIDLHASVKQVVSPLGKSAKTVTIYSPANSLSTTLNEDDAEVINKNEDDEITETKDLVVLITELDLKLGSCKVTIGDSKSNQRINAVITDPLLRNVNNIYSLAFAAGERIAVKAKLQMNDGEITKIYISDTGI